MRAVRAGVAVLVGALAVGLAPAARGDDGDIAAAQAAADAATQAVSDAETRLGELDVQIADAQHRLDDANAQLTTLRSVIQEAAINAYITRRSDMDTYLIAGDDLNRQVRQEALARFVTQTDIDAVDRYRTLAEDAQLAQQQLDAAREEQAQTVAALDARRRELDTRLANLQALERARQEAAAAAARAAAAQRAGGPISDAPSAPIVRGGGGFLCPVQGPVSFIDSWGYARSGGRRHQGVDMMSPRGTPTVAPVAGRVEHRGNRVGGLSWHLYGDDGNYYYGTHLDSYANVGAGHVAAGTVIGYVGDSGNARGAGTHLHFEIHPNNGAAVNPYPTVRAAC
jgi:murein DD-endopeptidase MepM/ murein hydrolase activator NlpD